MRVIGCGSAERLGDTEARRTKFFLCSFVCVVDDDDDEGGGGGGEGE